MIRSGLVITTVIGVLSLSAAAEGGEDSHVAPPGDGTELTAAARPLVDDEQVEASTRSEEAGLRSLLGLAAREKDPFEGFARPITNINFHHPFIRNEVRPLFMYHWFPETNAVDGGSLRLYAMQLHLALTSDLQFTLYKGGYVDLDAGAFDDDRGFADFAFGLKYKLWEDVEEPAALAVGVGYETKSGDRAVLEGMGSGFFDVFTSYAREVGDVNVIATAGVFLPRNSSEDNRTYHWHLHADYPLTPSLSPLVEVNGFHYDGNAHRNAGLGRDAPLGVEGYDYTTLGADDVRGNDVITGALGMRYALSEDISLGAAWEVPLTSRKDVFQKRLTLDLVLRF